MSEYPGLQLQYEPSSITALINTLRTIQGQKSNVYYSGRIAEYSVNLNEPVSSERIVLAENEIGQKFPKELVELLRLTDGLSLREDETKICSIEHMLILYNAMTIYFENMVVIATLEGASVHVVMEILENDKYRLYYTDVIADNDLWYIGDSLLEFLDILISVNGAPYWKWSKRTDEFKPRAE